MPAGVCYNLYKLTGDLASFDEAIAHERKALDAWAQIVSAAGDVYSENLAFGAHAVGFSRHWKEEYQILGRNFEQVLAERQKAVGRSGAVHWPLRTMAGAPPAVKLLPVTSAQPGRDVEVSASVQAPAGIRWVRLRYRHVTQFEDYQTADMMPDRKTGLYTARIPASFIDPKWNLMYFIEAVDKNGAGRSYPDLEFETPYVVVAVSR